MGARLVSAVLRHVCDSIGVASHVQAEAARATVASAGAPMLERLAARLGGAQHTSRPRGTRRLIIVVAADHGAGDPGVSLGPDHPTVIAAQQIMAGTAALSHLARTAGTPIVLVDAGAREPRFMPTVAIALGRGPTHDLALEPAMTVVDATLGLEAGIALAMSLAGSPGDEPLALLVLGALGLGAEVSSAALVGALTGSVPAGLDDPHAELVAYRGATRPALSALDALAAFGGAETAVLAGLILGAASINVPVILDSYATGSAALVAAAFAPTVTGYLVAAHRGSFTMPAILTHLGLEPVFEVGLGHGEGAGAAMVLPLVDQVVALAAS